MTNMPDDDSLGGHVDEYMSDPDVEQPPLRVGGDVLDPEWSDQSGWLYSGFRLKKGTIPVIAAASIALLVFLAWQAADQNPSDVVAEREVVDNDNEDEGLDSGDDRASGSFGSGSADTIDLLGNEQEDLEAELADDVAASGEDSTSTTEDSTSTTEDSTSTTEDSTAGSTTTEQPTTSSSTTTEATTSSTSTVTTAAEATTTTTTTEVTTTTTESTTTTTTDNEPVTEGVVVLRNGATGSCIAASRLEAAAAVVMEPCSAVARQLFTVDSNGGDFVFANAENGMILDMARSSTRSGQQAIIYPAQYTDNQLWQLSPSAGGQAVANVNSRLCLRANRGDLVVQRACDGSASQAWTFVPAGNLGN